MVGGGGEGGPEAAEGAAAKAAEWRAMLDALSFSRLRDFSAETNWVSEATGPHVQGVLNLADNAAQDGGTQLVPGFAAAFDSWARALGPVEHHSDAAALAARARGERGRPWVIPRQHGCGSFKFSPEDPLNALAVRVPLAEGSLLVWDQRTAHGAVPNRSGRPRLAQFVKAMRVAPVAGARVKARAAAVEREARAAGAWEGITPLGRRVFGLAWGDGAEEVDDSALLGDSDGVARTLIGQRS